MKAPTAVVLAVAALVAVAAVPSAALRIPARILDAPPNGGKNYAVLVAGSNTWGNYRHQADVCHAYQVLVSHGMPASQIIVFQYDDIANNSQNPTPGVIINQPNGPNVYKGVAIDYKAADVTPENFLNVLKGDAAAMKGKGTGRVLTSTANDHVFIFFSDHGGPGIIAFPSELLQATDLNNALKYMHTNNMYAQLLFYLEACESGSMFDGILPTNINVYATTASNPTTSSYACYYDNQRQTYLGDVYSVNWMQDSDAANLNVETIAQQYAIVRRATNTSQVCEYGTKTFTSETLINFQGTSGSYPIFNVGPTDPAPITDAVDSREVELEILRNRLAAASSQSERDTISAELQAELGRRNFARDLFRQIVEEVAGPEAVDEHMTARLKVTNHACSEAAILAFHNNCFNLGQNSWALQYAMSFVSLCQSTTKLFTAESILGAVESVCPMKGKATGVIY